MGIMETSKKGKVKSKNKQSKDKKEDQVTRPEKPIVPQNRGSEI